MKISIVLLVMLVILNGSFAKNKVPGCTGSKGSVCKKLTKMTEDFDECESEKKELEKEIEEGSAENERLEKQLEQLEEDKEKLEEEIEVGSAENKRLEEENDKLKEQIEACEKSKGELIEKTEYYEKELAECNKPTDAPATDAPTVKAPKSCLEIKNAGETTNGWYMIDPDGQGAFEVFCDLNSQGGGWAIVQRRNGGSVDFSRDWNEYKNGFGTKTEWWTGLDKIHRMTGQGCELRVSLIDLDGKSAQDFFDGFSVGPESSDYQLKSGKFVKGTAGDSMSYHNGRKFSTKDRDNDVANSNCAVSLNGGWWYSGIGAKCADANLNGQYGKNVFYRSWKGGNYSLKMTAVRVRC